MTTQTTTLARDMPYRALNAADERALITRAHDGDTDALADLTATYARAIFRAADMALATATNGRRVRRADHDGAVNIAAAAFAQCVRYFDTSRPIAESLSWDVPAAMRGAVWAAGIPRSHLALV